MPFTKSGLTPDLIINPHAIPSRMTCGHVLEMLCSMASALEGEHTDATAFNKLDQKEIQQVLKRHGYDPLGRHEMFCGITGKKIQCNVYMGMCYYQRLKHMPKDKVTLGCGFRVCANINCSIVCRSTHAQEALLT